MGWWEKRGEEREDWVMDVCSLVRSRFDLLQLLSMESAWVLIIGRVEIHFRKG